MKNNLRIILAFTLGAFTCLLYAGESVTKQCEQCHAENAQASVLAPVLNGMPAWYIKDQIQNFQTGQRNSTSENAQFIDAAHQAHTFNSQQLDDIADHYEDNDRTISTLTVTGDPQKGAPHFDEDCASCHTSAFGRFLSDSPEITQLEGPYIFSQLKAFKSGQRNFTEETKSHRKMVDRIKQYSDEELADIVAYIKANAHTL